MDEMSGTMTGATAGMAAGPIGAAVGAGAGLMSDLFNRKEKKKQEAASRPKNRRLSQVQDSLQAYREQKMAGALSLSQAAFDWGSQMRL